LFHREEDFERFMRYITRYIEKCKEYFDILAYCILPNHFHFVFHSKIDGYKISYFIGNICSAYIRYYLMKYEMEKGRIYFENRFKCKCIEDDEYLQQCIHYVENNPIKHGLRDKSEDWIFRSKNSLPGVKNQIDNIDADLE
jgi:REP element-mobilizing transposase RayT